MSVEGDRGAPINQGEEVYWEAPGSILAVLIGQIGVVGPETPGEWNRRPNRRLGTRVQVTRWAEE